MLDQLVPWLREQQVKVQEGMFAHPPKDWAEFRERIAEERAFRDVLTQIDAFQNSAEERESRS